MQGEYNGKPIFRHRYVSLNEEAIREEINRLQDELYSMQEVLELVTRDNKALKQQAIEGQENNERLLKELLNKVQNLREALDYSTPLKAQVAEATAEFKSKMEAIYTSASKDGGKYSSKALMVCTVINTVLLLILIGLVGYFLISLR